MAMFAALVLLTFAGIVGYMLLAVYAERKISAFIQDRVGPNRVGPFGLLQTTADILKLIQKEWIRPSGSYQFFMLLAPVLVFLSVFLGFAALPFYSGDLHLGLFYLVAVLGLEVTGILMASWASNSKYATLGGLRSAAQMMAYEVPAGLVIVAMALLHQSLDLGFIVQSQSAQAADPVGLLGLGDMRAQAGFLTWNLFAAPHVWLAFLIFFITSLAQANRAPFDLPEAESELVAGFHTEYSGFNFALFFLGEYAMMLLMALVMSLMFLGGWHSPVPDLGWFKGYTWTMGPVWSVVWLGAKTLGLVALMMWIRWTLPRFRVDQLMRFNWVWLTPIAIGLVLFSALWVSLNL